MREHQKHSLIFIKRCIERESELTRQILPFPVLTHRKSIWFFTFYTFIHLYNFLFSFYLEVKEHYIDDGYNKEKKKKEGKESRNNSLVTTKKKSQ